MATLSVADEFACANSRIDNYDMNHTVSILIAALLFLSGCQTIRTESFDAIVETVEDRHPVGNISAEALTDSMANEGFGERFAIFDAREGEEYAVSRIKGALRVDEGTSASAFAEQFGGTIEGKTVVFYCSIGYRSSVLAERLVDATGDSAQSLNLRGGIFGWYNGGRNVYNDAGETDEVHPYSAFWGRLLESRIENRK